MEAVVRQSEIGAGNRWEAIGKGAPTTIVVVIITSVRQIEMLGKKSVISKSVTSILNIRNLRLMNFKLNQARMSTQILYQFGFWSLFKKKIKTLVK
jgi:hypothetical protein